MRQFNAHTFDDWPRRMNEELIFETTNEAIYFANITDDRLGAYNLLKKWRERAYKEIKAVKAKRTINFNRAFDLAVRAQFYRECMEEIERLNEEEP